MQQALGVRRRPVLQFRQVAPHRHPGGVGGVDGPGMLDPARLILGVPFRMLAHQGRVDGGMVDHQIQHHLEVAAGRLLQKVAQGRLGILPGFRIKERVEAEVVLDGIKAAAHPRGVDGIQEDPGEAHPGDAVQMFLPPGDRPHQRRKKIIDQSGFRHG